MSKVKYISSLNEIPVGQQYVLVVYGEEYAQTKHPLGLTITVASTVESAFLLDGHSHGQGDRQARRNIRGFCLHCRDTGT